MSLKTCKEIVVTIKDRYQKATSLQKKKILDELTALTGYHRKYALSVLNKKNKSPVKNKAKKVNARKYNPAVQQALTTLWYAANKICAKRLVPFIPDLLNALERFGHVSLPEDVRSQLLKISPATADRLLNSERHASSKGISTTSPGSLLKKQIKVRTFTDWDDIVPGFLEGDLVAHCGGRVDGSFLNTLVLTDIASTWTEFFPLLKKGESEVIAALNIAKKILPMSLLGLDTDNGSEFINHALFNFCTDEKITFTRSRPYKSNDQAHVEEKNGSIVRRIVGYDRYEGLAAVDALAALYAPLRLYVNFFQPSLKLISKERDGAKVSKKYDKAKTPYQRLQSSDLISTEVKNKLTAQYETLDPLGLLREISKQQEEFWTHSWKPLDIPLATDSVQTPMDQEICDLLKIESIKPRAQKLRLGKFASPVNSSILCFEASIDSASNSLAPKTLEKESIPEIHQYHKSKKQKPPRDWKTREDSFSTVWSQIRIKLELDPDRTASDLLNELMQEKPEQYKIGQLRTLQRRVAIWRVQDVKDREQSILASYEAENAFSDFAVN